MTLMQRYAWKDAGSFTTSDKNNSIYNSSVVKLDKIEYVTQNWYYSPFIQLKYFEVSKNILSSTSFVYEFQLLVKKKDYPFIL